MRRIGCLGVITLIALAPLAHAQISRDLAEASASVGQGVPEVAVVRLRSLLAQNLRGDEWRSVALTLAEALVASKEPEEALTILRDPRLRDVGAAVFWRAQALAGLQRWAEALPLYMQLAHDRNSPLHAEALFGQAEALRGLNRNGEALAALHSLFLDKQWATPARLRAAELYIANDDTANARRVLDELQLQPTSAAERKERRLLRGRLELLLRKADRALDAFEGIVKKPQNASHAVVIGALYGIADAHLQLNTPEAGDDVLENFIERDPHDVDLALVFAKLDELYRAERKISRTELERWARDPAQPRRGLAQWYLARLDLRAGRRDRAMESFAAVRRSETKFAELVPALLEYAQLTLEEGDLNRALSVLNYARTVQPDSTLRDRINFLAASVQYRMKRFEPATAEFEQIAGSNSRWSKLALFNASIGWLRLGNQDRFMADYKKFEEQGGDADSRTRLRLEQGLMQASKGDPKAAESLVNFVREFPQDRRVSEAWVALAELAFHSIPPRIDEAKKDLTVAATNPTPAAAERADYLTIWIEDMASGSEARVIELANRFLQQHGESRFAADVRMKLAETYYRRHDLANAQTQFELIAQQNPTSPFAEKALFFAAESAIASMGAHSLDRGLVLLDQVVRSNGELKWSARNEEALVERKLGKPQDALLLYDEVLKGDGRPGEKREALCGKADILFEQAGSDNYHRAIEMYTQLAADNDAPLHWRNQALFKKALCLEKIGDRTAALETFYSVLEDPRLERRHEEFWYFKAGFNAARLLEEQSKWGSAAAVYQKLAAIGGARSGEAKERLDRLRLEHFLWEQ
ncbi:MAG TPA: tetratricopeptide repeat protein [Chthoniobacterales bacterium]|nr:tetratricopeptide repeat protein [Chthoniobacterales bacterium]